MSSHDSARLVDFFVARTRVVEGAPEAVTVLFAPVAIDPDVTQWCACVLSDEERRAAEGKLTADLRARFIQRRAFHRYCAARASGSEHLAEVRFAFSEKGAPHLPAQPELTLGFSTCRGGYLAAWSRLYAIGVDVEDRTPVEAVDLARAYFTPGEARHVALAEPAARLDVFLQLWTLKEAALKSVGEGLPFGLDAFAFELAIGPHMLQAPEGFGGTANFSTYLLQVGGCQAALVLANKKMTAPPRVVTNSLASL